MDKQIMSFNPSANFIRTGLSLAVAVMSYSATAQEVHKLEKVIVTATRTAQTVDETLAPVTVIDREEIERMQTVTVVELLNQAAPGVQVTSNGGPGSNSGVYIRGTKTAQTLVLLNGQKINTANSGSAPLEFIDPGQVERIEIVRGPRSSLYGADAVGGVINIISRKGSGAPKVSVKAGGGSRKTGEYAINIGGERNDVRFNLGGRLLETQGYDRTTEGQGTNQDDDAYRNKSLSGTLSKDFDNGIEGGVNFTYFTGKSEYDGYGISDHLESQFTERMVSTYLSKNITDVWSARIEGGFVKDERKELDHGVKKNFAENKNYSLSWLNDVVWADNQLLTAGIDYSKDRVASDATYVVDDRDNKAVFAQNQTFFAGSDLQLSGRYDDNEAFGGQWTGGASWGFALPEQMRLIASYSTAFRAPTFGDMYRESLGFYSSIPNLNLKAEHSKNAELALTGQVGNVGTWSFNVYQNSMDDMLSSVEVRPRTYQTINIDKARIRGVEFEFSTQIKNINVSTNFTYLDPENRSGKNKGKKLHYRAQKLAALNLDRDFGRWAIGGTLKAQGKIWTNPENTKQIPGYGTFDLRAMVKLSTDTKMQFKVNNLFDKKYEPVTGYQGEPRGVFATIIWSPEI
ncbi:TonB-dependent receptor domain-containing protein [Endozoicomonas ascidiicola]|uniref:TonB-dependent receptor domain-containing protein n=1 Tax=Endozoicomonas ascidiicola TaxID=1698521 RepID=UPI000BA3E02D|nr:TonB-dependent receptor [Endozoicomonas ascidiicola]